MYVLYIFQNITKLSLTIPIYINLHQVKARAICELLLELPVEFAACVSGAAILCLGKNKSFIFKSKHTFIILLCIFSRKNFPNVSVLLLFNILLFGFFVRPLFEFIISRSRRRSFIFLILFSRCWADCFLRVAFVFFSVLFYLIFIANFKFKTLRLRIISMRTIKISAAVPTA